jgi:hypothetical protein
VESKELTEESESPFRYYKVEAWIKGSHSHCHMATCTLMHGHIHADTWPHASEHMVMCMRIHGHIHMDTKDKLM